MVIIVILIIIVVISTHARIIITGLSNSSFGDLCAEQLMSLQPGQWFGSSGPVHRRQGEWAQEPNSV